MEWGDKFSYFKKMHAELKAQHFDLVIDLQGLFKSSVLAASDRLSQPDRLLRDAEGSGLVSKAVTGSHAKDHVIERYLDVARSLGCTVDKIEFPMPDLSAEWAQVQAKLAGIREYVVIAPGARWATKTYPAGHFAKLAQLLLAEGTNVVLAAARTRKASAPRLRCG
jgi:heptosyltransferase-1/heptosyltransferase-2